MKIRIGKCADCKKVSVIGGRNLDSTCYSYHHKNKTLDQFPRSTWSNAELMAELDICRSRGLSLQESAETIGVKLPTLRKAISRAKEREARAVGPAEQGAYDQLTEPDNINRRRTGRRRISTHA